MQVRGTNAVQLFWVYTNRPDEVIEEITRQWDAALNCPARNVVESGHETATWSPSAYVERRFRRIQRP